MRKVPLDAKSCLVLLNKKDGKAFHYLMDKYFAVLCSFAEYYLDDRHKAEDIAEESFIKLWKTQGSFESIDAVRNFLYLSARNACLNRIRDDKRAEKRHKDYVERHGGEEKMALNEIIREEVLTEIQKAVETLPPQMRKVFILSFIEGKKNQEIADELKTSINTVKNQKVRALQLLRLQLQDKDLLMVIFLLAQIHRD